MIFCSRPPVALAVLLLSLLAAAFPISCAVAQDADTVKEVTKGAAAPLTPEAAKRCDENWKRIQGFYTALPKDLSGLSGSAADELTMGTEKTLIVCGQFLAECEAHAKYHDVELITAKLLFLLSGRRKAEWITLGRDRADYVDWLRGKMGAYMGDIEKLARQAFAGLPADNPLRPRALEIAGQACAEAEQYDEARKEYEKFLTTFPKDPEVCRIQLALARACYDMSKHEDGLKAIKAAMDGCYPSEQFPFFGEMHWKLAHALGDLEEMAACVKRIETVYPLRLKGTSLKAGERESYERFLAFNGFRKAYTAFAAGDFNAAREAFKQHIAAIDAMEEALHKDKKELKPEVKIYRDRSVTVLKVVEELAGLPAPADFDLGTGWSTQKKVRVAESRGKVIGVVFRGVNEERSAAFIGPLSQFCAREPEMELVTITYRKTGGDLSKQLDEVRDELGKLGYDGAAGLDPDDAQKTIFRRYLANIGSATFVILNRRGELIWYMQDPRGVDVQFAESLLRRAAK